MLPQCHPKSKTSMIDHPSHLYTSNMQRFPREYETPWKMEHKLLYNSYRAGTAPCHKVEFDKMYDLHCRETAAKQKDDCSQTVQSETPWHRSEFELMYASHCRQVASQRRKEQQKCGLTTVQTEGVGAAAAAITGGVAKAALGTAKLAGKTAIFTAKAVEKVAVVTGKIAVKASVAVEKAAQKSAVSAAKAAQKSAVAAAKAAQKTTVSAAKATKKAVVDAEKTAMKALRKQSKSHGDTEPQGIADSLDLAVIPDPTLP